MKSKNLTENTKDAFKFLLFIVSLLFKPASILHLLSSWSFWSVQVPPRQKKVDQHDANLGGKIVKRYCEGIIQGTAVQLQNGSSIQGILCLMCVLLVILELIQITRQQLM